MIRTTQHLNATKKNLSKFQLALAELEKEKSTKRPFGI
jgi:hypothetical protein